MSTRADIHALLKANFGFESFRGQQEVVIRRVLAGGDSLLLMPTGGGKSLCYQLPALAMDGVTLVISPLIALMKDQVDGLNANGIAARFINSTLPVRDVEGVQGGGSSRARQDPLHRAGAAGRRGIPSLPERAEGEPDRHRRGALHLGVGGTSSGPTTGTCCSFARCSRGRRCWR